MDPWAVAAMGLCAGALAGWGLRRRGDRGAAPAAPPEALARLAERLEASAGREERLEERARALDRREQALQEAEQRARAAEEEAGARRRAAEEREDEALARVERAGAEARRIVAEASSLTPEEARRRLLADLDRELEAEKARRVATALEEARREARERGREILVAALERMPAEVCAATTVVRVPLGGEEMKGRVIGREGRNIRAFEAATGCDVLLEEGDGQVTISGFDPVRREVARRAMERLLADGRVQPARIEEVVAEVRGQVEAGLEERGGAACAEAGVEGLHPRLLEMLGRMHFRTSFGQNALRHSVECARLAGMIAAELGLDAPLARRAALLHDVGKVADPALEGSHHEIAAQIAAGCEEPAAVVQAIAASHEGGAAGTVYAAVARIADALSASRPGARREDAERFVRRLQDLEALAAAFPGVSQAYAIQAGREVRVLVDAGKVSDLMAPRLAWEIARAVEERLHVQGEVKVTVVREVRASETAR